MPQLATGQPPTTSAPNPPPRLGEVSSEGQAFFRIPATVTQMLDDVTSRYRTVVIGNQVYVNFDEQAARQAVYDRLGDRFNEQQKEEIFRYVWGIYSHTLRENGARDLHDAELRGDRPARDASYAIIGAGINGLVGLNQGTDLNLWYGSLRTAATGLSREQQEDMLRGAMQAGAPVAAVTAVAQEFGLISQRGQQGEQESPQQAAFMLQLIADGMRTTDRLRTTLQALEDRREEDEKARADYDREFRRLSVFLSGTPLANTALKATGKEDPVIRVAVEDQINRGRLHAGDMSVTPRLAA